MLLYPCNCITATQQYPCCVDPFSPRWSFLRLTDRHPSCSSQHCFFYSWVCFWKSVHSILSLVICLVTNVWILFLSGSSLWNKRLPRCICFFKCFCMVTCILCIFFFFFFNFLIFLSFCRFKNHKFVRRKNNILLNFIINLCGSNLMLSSFFFSGHKYLSLYDLMFLLT